MVVVFALVSGHNSSAFVGYFSPVNCLIMHGVRHIKRCKLKKYDKLKQLQQVDRRLLHVCHGEPLKV